jgi:transcriptional regulator with XRE-family HTH domain
MTERFNGLRGWRERNGLALAELGDLTGFSPSYISRIERGERELQPLDKVRVARLLGCRVRDIFPARRQP